MHGHVYLCRQSTFDAENIDQGVIDRDFNEFVSFEDCLEAASQGNFEAQFQLGQFYDIGDFVPANKEEAFRYYKLAADSGHVGAMYMVALCYDLGDGVQLSRADANRYYNLAASKGHKYAQQAIRNNFDFDSNVREHSIKSVVVSYSILYLEGFFKGSRALEIKSPNNTPSVIRTNYDEMSSNKQYSSNRIIDNILMSPLFGRNAADAASPITWAANKSPVRNDNIEVDDVNLLIINDSCNGFEVGSISECVINDDSSIDRLKCSQPIKLDSSRNKAASIKKRIQDHHSNDNKLNLNYFSFEWCEKWLTSFAQITNEHTELDDENGFDLLEKRDVSFIGVI